MHRHAGYIHVYLCMPMYAYIRLMCPPHRGPLFWLNYGAGFIFNVPYVRRGWKSCVSCARRCARLIFIESRPLGLERTTASTTHLQLDMCARPIANNYRESSEDRSRGRWKQIIITRSSRGNRKVKRKWPCGNMNVKMRQEPCVLFILEIRQLSYDIK